MNAIAPRDLVSALPVPLNPEKPTPAEKSLFTSAKLDRIDWIIRDPDPRMTSTAKLAGVFLLQCVNSETLQCNPSYRTIADTLGFKSEKTAERAVEALEACGWIGVVRFNRNKSNRYIFLPNDARTKAIDEYTTLMAVKRADERTTLEQTKLSGREYLEQTKLSGPDQTNLSGKHLKGTPEVDSRYEGEEPIKVSPATSGDASDLIPAPDAPDQADEVIADLVGGMELPAPVQGYFRQELIAGRLRRSTVAEWLRVAA